MIPGPIKLPRGLRFSAAYDEVTGDGDLHVCITARGEAHRMEDAVRLARAATLAPRMVEILEAVLACPQAAPWLARLPMDDGCTTVWDAARRALDDIKGAA